MKKVLDKSINFRYFLSHDKDVQQYRYYESRFYNEELSVQEEQEVYQQLVRYKKKLLQRQNEIMEYIK